VEELYGVFSSLCDGVLSIVLVEQYVTYALSLCDQAIVLDNGEISLQGRSEDLMTQNALSEAYLG
jgi:ABC-type branched-subunit amino acid transport system ATPase component